VADCLIGLGSNLGNRQETLDRAVARLSRSPNVSLVARSRWRETAPVGGPPGQGPFLNGAVLLETGLEPDALLSLLKTMETDFGRGLGERWGPRPLDLDLLLYGGLVLRTPALVLPHPRMAWRRFVLEPAVEVAASMIHPTTGWTVGRLLDHLNTAAPYVAIAGPIGAGKTELAETLARETGARLVAEPIDLPPLEAFRADPSGRALALALEFLQRRTRLLAVDLPQWGGAGRLAVSDFWLDQCLAFARVRLPAGQMAALRQRWEQGRTRIVQPKLIVLLDSPVEQIVERMRRLGRGDAPAGGLELLERIRREILAEATQPDRGPLLHLTTEDPQHVLSEALAAVEAMK
jgi:2-amino-4-hydroxy-6-hydroxymethyldihydropteridine diphosphokinase